MNQFNELHGDEPDELPREWNSQPPSARVKYRTSPSKPNPVASAIMGRLNHHSIDNGDVKLSPLYFQVEFNYESIPDPDTTSIKSIYGY